MGTKMNKRAYRGMILENVKWLAKQNEGPIDFVIRLVQISTYLIYTLRVDDDDFKAKLDEALRWLEDTPRCLERSHVDQILRWYKMFLSLRSPRVAWGRWNELLGPAGIQTPDELKELLTPRTYFVSGHLDLTDEEFVENYKGPIDEAIDEGAMFVVGDAKGCDTKFMTYMADRCLVDRLRIFHMLSEPRNHVAGAELVGGFETDKARDEAMTNCSNEDIAWVRPGREGCGTDKNLARRRRWTHIGGDLEARFDGRMCVDIRSRGKSKTRIFMKDQTLENALSLFPKS